MISSAHDLGRTTRRLLYGTPLLFTACALHGASHDSAVLAPAVSAGRPTPSVTAADERPPVTTSYVAESPSFTLISSSLVMMDPSVHALRSTAAAFARLFGEPAPQLGVIVTDTTDGSPSAATTPAADVPTVTVVSSGLTGLAGTDPAAMLASEVRFEAAKSWLGEYAALWSGTLDRRGIQFTTPQGDLIPRATTLPDWLHVAVLRMLTDPDPDPMSARGVALDVDTTTPARALFARRLSPREAAAFELLLQRPSLPASTSAGDGMKMPETQALLRFVDQSASVLRYLRASQGEEAVADLLGASVAGLGMDDILQRLPHPTTPEALDAGWRLWMSNQTAGR